MSRKEIEEDATLGSAKEVMKHCSNEQNTR